MLAFTPLNKILLLGEETRERLENPTRVSIAGASAAGNGGCVENKGAGVLGTGKTGGAGTSGTEVGDAGKTPCAGGSWDCGAGGGGAGSCAEASLAHNKSNVTNHKHFFAAFFVCSGNRVPQENAAKKVAVPGFLLTHFSLKKPRALPKHRLWGDKSNQVISRMAGSGKP